MNCLQFRDLGLVDVGLIAVAILLTVAIVGLWRWSGP